MNNQKQLRVAIYIRVSTDEQAERFGVSLQKEAVLALIKSKVKLEDGRDAMVLAGKEHIYIDDGISGTTNLDERPEFSRLKENIFNSPEGAKPFDIVAVYKIDRFARRLKVLLDVMDFFKEHEIEFLSANESIDTSTPFGRAMLGIIGVIAELEIENIKLRTQDGRQSAVNVGVVMGSFAAFGFTKGADKTYKIFEPEAEIVQNIFYRFVVLRHTVQEIATYLTSQKILTPRPSAIAYGKMDAKPTKKNKAHHWSSTTVSKILKNELYIGRYYYHKNKNGKPLPQKQWKVSNYAVPILLDNITLFHKAQKLLAESKARASAAKASKNHSYLLSSLLKCDCCREKGDSEFDLISWVGDRKKMKNGKYTYSYKCGRKNAKKFSVTCNAIPIPADPLEDYVKERVRELLENPLPVFKYQQRLKSTQLEMDHLKKHREGLRKIINSIPDIKERIKEQHEHGHLGIKKLDQRIEEENQRLIRLRKELDDLNKRISERAIAKGYIEVFELFQEAYSSSLESIFADRQRTYDLIHILVDKIIVYSRPATMKDKIAGRKKKGKKQMVPHRLELKLRLPQEILQELYSNLPDGFGVEKRDL
jgi:site-specific DNA recombinase